MATRRVRRDDDPGWNEPGFGGDVDKPNRPPGSRQDYGLVTVIGEAFWRGMDTVPLSIPRWSSRPKMNANIKYMLRTHTKELIEASFVFFRSDTETLLLTPSCWDVYFRYRGKYLRLAQRAIEGRRAGETVHRAGDMRVDNERFHVHSPGEVPPDAPEPDEIDEAPEDVS